MGVISPNATEGSAPSVAASNTTPASGSGLIGGLFSAWNTSKTILANSLSARKARKEQRKLIDYQNEYNSPRNQRKLLSEAGLNPSLMFNQNLASSAVSNQNPSIPQADFSGLSGTDPMMLLNAKLLEAEIRKTDSETNKNNSESGKLDLESAKLELENDLLDQYGVEQIEAEISYKNSASLEAAANAFLARAREKVTTFELDNLLPKQVNKLEQECWKLAREIAVLDIDKEYKARYWMYTIDKFISEINLNDANTKLKDAEANLSNDMSVEGTIENVRSILENVIGPILLYFGCSQETVDNLLEAWSETGGAALRVMGSLGVFHFGASTSKSKTTGKVETKGTNTNVNTNTNTSHNVNENTGNTTVTHKNPPAPRKSWTRGSGVKVKGRNAYDAANEAYRKRRSAPDFKGTRKPSDMSAQERREMRSIEKGLKKYSKTPPQADHEVEEVEDLIDAYISLLFE